MNIKYIIIIIMAYSLNGTQVEQKFQLNGRPTATVTTDDIGTINADSAHDGLSTTISKGDTHDNNIFKNTSPDGTIISISSRTDLFIGSGDIPETGNLPHDNKCYVYDVHEGACLKGVNQSLDSADTPSVSNFIDCMIKKYLPAKTYNDVTGLNKNACDKLYLFKLYSSLLNVDGLTLHHRLDYSCYTNYDILIFIQVMVTCDHTLDAHFLIKLNTFLNKTNAIAATNDKIQYNKFKVITVCVLNYLWQKLMKYCESLIEPKGSNPHPKESLDALRKICFVNYASVEKGAEINFPLYQIGFTNPPIPDITMLDDDTQANNFILNIAHKIYEKINGLGPPVELPGKTFTFITAQHVCAKGILTLQNNKHIDNREGKSIKNKKEKQSMNEGLIQLFKGSGTPLTSAQKIFLFQILKFQGDSSHLVISHIIEDAHDTFCIKPAQKLRLEKEGTEYHYKLYTGPAVSPIEIIVLTGERPLLCRSVIEGVSIQALNFKVLNITGGYSHAIHISNACISIETQITKILTLVSTPLSKPPTYDVHSTINSILEKIHNGIITNYKELKTALSINSNKIKYESGIDLKLQPILTNLKFYAYSVLNDIKQNIINNIISKEQCTEISKLNIFDNMKISVNKKYLSLTYIKNILDTYSVVIEYFSQLKDNLSNITNISTIQHNVMKDNIPVFNQLLKFLNTTYKIFSPEAGKTFTYEEILKYEGIRVDHSADFKTVYDKVYSSLNPCKSFINKLLSAFYKTLGDINYIQYAKGSKTNGFKSLEVKCGDTEYIYQPLWNKDNPLYFKTNFSNFLKYQQKVDDSRTQDNLNKIKISEIITDITLILYEGLNIASPKNDIEKLIDITISIMNIHDNLSTFNDCQNVTPAKKGSAGKTMLNIADTTACIQNLIDDYSKLGMLTSDILLGIPPTIDTTAYAPAGNIIDALKTGSSITGAIFRVTRPNDINSTKNQLVNIIKFTQFTIDKIFDNFATNSTALLTSLNGHGKATEIDMNTMTAGNKTIFENLISLRVSGLIHYKSGHMSTRIINTLNAIIDYYEFKYIDLTGTSQKVEPKDFILLHEYAKTPTKISGGTQKYKQNKKYNKTLKGGSDAGSEYNKTTIQDFNKFYETFLESDKQTFNYSLYKEFTKMKINTIINSAGYENITSYIENKNVLMISNILTNIYYSINGVKPDLKCLLFSPNTYEKEEQRLSQKFKIITKEKANYEKSIHAKDAVYRIDTEINFNTPIKDIINIVNNKKYPDKLEIVSLISKSLYFYINNGKRVNKILLNNDTYKQWCENISNNKYVTIGDYINLDKWLKNSDLNILLNTQYTELTYTKQKFKQNYFFFLISGSGTAKREDVKGENVEVTITNKQIVDYKNTVKQYMKYDLIREYSIIDFILKILKLKTNISYVNREQSDLFRLFDIYYMYDKSEKYINMKNT